MATRNNIVVKAARPQPKIAKFQVSAALFEELGERLVSKPEVALAELIKNAYDADAVTCTLHITSEELRISDDGHGMTEGEFLRNWMVISTQEKGKARYSRTFRRGMAGSKGVGRFSARFLGYMLELTSIARDPKTGLRTQLVAQFDWRTMSQESNISTIDIPYTVSALSAEGPCGTVLRVHGLRTEAKRISLAKIKTDVLRLTDPMVGLEPPPFLHAADRSSDDPRDTGFSLSMRGRSAKSQPNSVGANVQAEILSKYVGRVRLSVMGDQLQYQVFWRDQPSPIESKSIKLSTISNIYSAEALQIGAEGVEADERGLPSAVADIAHLPVACALTSPVFIDLRFFPSRPGAFADMGVDGRVAQSWVRDSASVAIVDNNFTMSAYADAASDWLQLNANKASNERNWQSIFTSTLYPMDAADKVDPSRNAMLALPTGKQLIGRVHIASSRPLTATTKDDEDWLQPNMDRESLRANDGFRLLWHVSRFATELLAHFDRKLRLEEEERRYKREAKVARTGLTKAISEIRKSPSIAPEFRSKIVEQLQAVQTRYSATSEYEREARLSLELMSMMGVVAGFMTHEFEKAMHALSTAAELLRKVARSNPQFAEAATSMGQTENTLAHYMDYVRLFVERARQPKPQKFKAFAQVTTVAQTLSVTAAAHGITVDIEIDSQLPGPVMPLAAYHGIVINLVSNAMKALVAKVSGDPRRIRIYATNDGVKHVLVCADNGIGIPDYVKARIWDPLFTTTAQDDNPLGSGLGLGLSVVARVMKSLNGSIELMDTPPPGFVTAFRVTLPL